MCLEVGLVDGFDLWICRLEWGEWRMSVVGRLFCWRSALVGEFEGRRGGSGTLGPMMLLAFEELELRREGDLHRRRHRSKGK